MGRSIEQIVEEALGLGSIHGEQYKRDRAIAEKASRLAWAEAVERACAALCKWCDRGDKPHLQNSSVLHRKLLEGSAVCTWEHYCEDAYWPCKAEAIRSLKVSP